MQPTTEFEATMDSPGSPSDWYDITAINGINIPMQAVPIPGSFTPSGSSPYECGNPGAPAPSSGLLGCTWQVPTPAATSSPPWDYATSMRLIDPTIETNTSCNVDADCTTGQICGLKFTPIAGPTGNLVRECGYLAGTWGPVTLCSQNGAQGPISGAFQCATPLCNDEPMDPSFPAAKMPNAGCTASQSNFPVITCSSDSDCDKDNEANSMVCDLNGQSTGYCVPMVPTGLCPDGSVLNPVTKRCLQQPTASPTATPVPCTVDLDCDNGYTCTNGQCAITGQCNSNQDCPSPLIYSCSNGNNLSVPSPTATASPGATPTPSATPTPGQCVPNLFSIYGGTAFAPASFFNNGTTNGQLATGWTDWSNINGGDPLPSGIPTPSLAPNPNWINHALPFEELLKTACPTAYSYQYDDPYSTFTCDSASNTNQMGYTITFCPVGSPSDATFPTKTPTP